MTSSLCQMAGKENQKRFANTDADDENFQSPKKKCSQKKSGDIRNNQRVLIHLPILSEALTGPSPIGEHSRTAGIRELPF